MIALSLAEVAQLTGGELHGAPDDGARVTGAVTLDSRSVGRGDLFVASRGSASTGTTSSAQRPAPGPSPPSPRGRTTRCRASSSPIRSPPWAAWPPACTSGSSPAG